MSQPKRPKLEKPLIFRGVSCKQLLQIVQAIKADPSIMDIPQHEFLNLHSSTREFQKLTQKLAFKLTNGNSYDWVVASVPDLLCYHFEFNHVFRMGLEEALRTHRLPFNLYTYLDEVTAGNPLRPDNKRKSYVWYVGIREMGLHLQNELAWIPIAFLPSTVKDRIPEGISEAGASLYSNMLKDCRMRLGFALPNGTLLQLQVKPPVADEAALKLLWGFKGSGGLKPCFLCSNVLKKNHDMLALDPGFTDITSANPGEWTFVKDEEIFSTQDRLHEAANWMGKGRLDNLQKCCGQNLQKFGMLKNDDVRNGLKPTDSQFDGMHCYFSNGVGGLEIDLILQEIEDKMVLDVNKLLEFCNGWQPTQKFLIADGQFKGMARSTMAFIPIFNHFLQKEVAPLGVLEAHLKSFAQLSAVVCQLRVVKNQFPVQEIWLLIDFWLWAAQLMLDFHLFSTHWLVIAVVVLLLL